MPARWEMSEEQLYEAVRDLAVRLAGQDPTPEQHIWLTALTAAGADAAVWRPADLRSDRVRTELQQLRRPPGFTCPRCFRTSYHPEDRRQGYCGACNDWTDSTAPESPLRGRLPR